MPVFRWGHHWGEAFHDLEREVDRLLNSVNMTFQGLRFGRQFPPINLYELSEEYLLTSELPGVKIEDLELTIAAGVLTIRCSRTEDGSNDESRYRRQERPRGTWQRSLTIPDRILEEELRADLTNGILRIHLPKAPQEKPRQIPVMGN